MSLELFAFHFHIPQRGHVIKFIFYIPLQAFKSIVYIFIVTFRSVSTVSCHGPQGVLVSGPYIGCSCVSNGVLTID